jgi:hypothetical protein
MSARANPTRRQALAGVAAMATGTALPAVAAAADPQKDRERRAVRSAVAAEQATAVAFEAIANSTLLDDRAAGTMRVLLDHATAHVTALEDAFKSIYGEGPPLAPKRTEIRGLIHPRGARAALALAERLESAAIARHLDAIRLSRNSTLLKLIAGSMGTDAQHLVMLRQLLHQDPAPDAFERG